MNDMELINEAITAMKNSYSPYSGFCVGAAVLTSNGRVYSGFNIENASYSATVCAERTALFSALTNGEEEFVKMAIVGGNCAQIKDFCYPCGVCRQVISEFCGENFEILLYNGKDIKKLKLSELLPFSFGRDDLC